MSHLGVPPPGHRLDVIYHANTNLLLFFKDIPDMERATDMITGRPHVRGATIVVGEDDNSGVGELLLQHIESARESYKNRGRSPVRYYILF